MDYEIVKSIITKYERVGDLSCLSLLGVRVFEQVDSLSLLFGVDWAGKN